MPPYMDGFKVIFARVIKLSIICQIKGGAVNIMEGQRRHIFEAMYCL